MKKSKHKQKLLRHLQRQYHRHHPWRLEGGLYIPHAYDETSPKDVSWGDDVGFIQGKRRIMVWWEHPRLVYANAIDEQSYLEAGEIPHDNWLTENLQKNYRKVGASRKKIVSYTCREPSAEENLYHERLKNIRERISAEGIDLDVPLSLKQEDLTWGVGISLVAPIEVRNEKELAVLANLARRLLLQQTTLASEFPGYRYGREEWLKERENEADH